MKDPQDYYVYCYHSAEDEPYYIGKGRKRRAYTTHTNVAVPSDKTKILLLASNLSEAEAFRLEKEFISKLGRMLKGDGPLLNVRSGGQGGWSGRLSFATPGFESRRRIERSLFDRPNCDPCMYEGCTGKIFRTGLCHRHWTNEQSDFE